MTLTVAPGGEALVAVEAALSDELGRDPLPLRARQVAVAAVRADRSVSLPVTCPALALYFGSLEPRPHPRLFFSERDLRALASTIHQGALADLWHEYQDRPDGRRMYALGAGARESPSDLVRAVEAGAFLCLMTGEGHYLTAALHNVRALAAAPTWMESPEGKYPVDLGSADAARVLASAYDWLWDELPPEQRTAINHALVVRGIEPFLSSIDARIDYPATRNSHNWCAVVHGGMGVAALALLGEDPRAPLWVARLYEGLDAMLNAAPEDGGWGEGPGYWEFGFVPAFQFMDALRRASGGTLDMFARSFCQRTGAFGVYARVSGFNSVNFGDSVRGAWDRSLLLKLAGELRSPELQWAALERGSKVTHPFTFLWYDAHVSPRPPVDWPVSKHFPAIDWAFLRTGWESDATVLALRSGPRDTHSHLDAGSFILEAFGQPMIVDVGRGSYGPEYFSQKTRWDDPCTRTESHNTILINGANQIVGEDGGHIVKFSTSQHFDYVLADATSTYEGATKVLRHVLFVRPEYFVIYDQVETEGPSEVAFSLLREPEESRQALPDGSVLYEWRAGALLVKAVRPSGCRPEPGGEVKQYRCDRITHPGRTTKCDFLVVLYPLPARGDNPLPSVSARDEGAEVVLDSERSGTRSTVRIRPGHPAAIIEAECHRGGRRLLFESPT